MSNHSMADAPKKMSSLRLTGLCLVGLLALTGTSPAAGYSQPNEQPFSCITQVSVPMPYGTRLPEISQMYDIGGGRNPAGGANFGLLGPTPQSVKRESSPAAPITRELASDRTSPCATLHRFGSQLAHMTAQYPVSVARTPHSLSSPACGPLRP